MQWYEIVLIVAAALFVVGVIVWQIIRRKQGKGGCDCGCSNCSGSCSACQSKQKEEKK
ncbi:MAG: FeoB-associated Cys-rich membrane protein [Clostridia bacterium]|nr:FeoB-associated Cys-rich membrane protein [Clostridia bacterium]MDE6676998.1 FeoB-associated Cys-rich membrane protein [Clostridia bacterium]